MSKQSLKEMNVAIEHAIRAGKPCKPIINFMRHLQAYFMSNAEKLPQEYEYEADEWNDCDNEMPRESGAEHFYIIQGTTGKEYEACYNGSRFYPPGESNMQYYQVARWKKKK
jgi:hypothetical protein